MRTQDARACRSSPCLVCPCHNILPGDRSPFRGATPGAAPDFGNARDAIAPGAAREPSDRRVSLAVAMRSSRYLHAARARSVTSYWQSTWIRNPRGAEMTRLTEHSWQRVRRVAAQSAECRPGSVGSPSAGHAQDCARDVGPRCKDPTPRCMLRPGTLEVSGPRARPDSAWRFPLSITLPQATRCPRGTRCARRLPRGSIARAPRSRVQAPRSPADPRNPAP